jgi:hypothetical protein
MKKKAVKANLDFQLENPKQMGKAIRADYLALKDINKQFKNAEAKSTKSVYNFTRGLINSQKSKDQFITETKNLFDTSVKFKPASRKKMIQAVIDESGSAGSLFLVQNISSLKKKDARVYMKDFLKSGGGSGDVANWLNYAGQVLRKNNIKATGTAGAVVDALGDAAEWVVDTIEDGVDAILEAVDAIIDAFTDAGQALVNLFETVAEWTAEQLGNLLAALIEGGRQLIDFVGGTFAWAYDAVSTFIQAAFDVGFAIADLLETVVSESYWVLRRFVNGIIENLGPIGDILDFILTQVEDATSELWRRTLLALRFAEANLLEAVDWLADQTAAAVEGLLIAWESIGESLISFYEAALELGAEVWRLIGEATATIGNSIYYVYNFLTTSAVDFIFDFTRGLLDAGMALLDVVGWAVQQSIEIAGEIIRAALDVGETIGNMFIAMANDPAAAWETFVEAAFEIGQTLDDLLEAVFVETAQEFLDEVMEALDEIGTAYQDILEASLRLGGAFLADMIAYLFNLLGSYRGLTDEERADAQLVFGNSLDYDLVFLSNEDPLNAIIFAIQDLFSGNPDSRAFVTGNLINLDESDGTWDRATLIHELTHVWQHREIGGIYMANAILAQAVGAGYNYGYSASTSDPTLNVESDYDGNTMETTRHGSDIGLNGETALNDARGDFNVFNEEQQGQILMHWFVRTQLEVTDTVGVVQNFDATAWDPYQQFVFNS